MVRRLDESNLLHLLQRENEDVVPASDVEVRVVHLQLDDLREEIDLQRRLVLLGIIYN